MELPRQQVQRNTLKGACFEDLRKRICTSWDGVVISIPIKPVGANYDVQFKFRLGSCQDIFEF